ncbi:EexN family lipoprotein [Methylocystis sp. IM4]|uniref:EexN family lipoprotein n=2 Tax=Methylocystis TaxID=133 RepID=UPI00311A82E9
MKRSSLLFLSCVMSAALAGCGEDRRPRAPSSNVSGKQSASQPAKTVSWFIEHRDELQATMTACRDNPGALAKTPDCVNASAARDKIMVQEMKDALK